MTATRPRRTGYAGNTTPNTTTILDLFAGPGGWSHALRLLRLADVGIELDASACATRRAAGYATIRADVASLPVAHLRGKVKGLLGSPPCQGMSTAGLHAGWADVELIGSLLTDLARGRDTRADRAAQVADPRSLLIAEPLRYALAAMPEWVACEQVPAVLPLWRETARHLEAAGYSTWCGLLNAADYGLAQTRRRAFLIASRVRRVRRPAPTHSQSPDAPDMLFGDPRKAWVSMADALGWTGSATVNVRGEHVGGGSEFSTDRPAQALTHSARSWKLRSGTRANASVRSATEPAATLLFGHASNDVSWVAERPATTIVGTPRVAKPGHRDRAGGERQYQDAVRITIEEASILQGFPADYPWQGSRTKAFEQIGNAVPPPLARAVLAVATGNEANA